MKKETEDEILNYKKSIDAREHKHFLKRFVQKKHNLSYLQFPKSQETHEYLGEPFIDDDLNNCCMAKEEGILALRKV